MNLPVEEKTIRDQSISTFASFQARKSIGHLAINIHYASRLEAGLRKRQILTLLVMWGVTIFLLT